MAKSSPKKLVAKKARPCNARGYKRTKGLSLRKGNKEVASKRGEMVDFKDLTHTVTEGVFEGFQGIKISDDEASDNGKEVSMRLLKNPRGCRMKISRTISVKEDDVRELTSNDMVESIDIVGDEAEDKELIEYEKGTWECSKCEHLNGNDAGYCGKVVDEFGNKCGGTKRCEMGTWDGFFQATETWKCNVCTVANAMDKANCAACEAARETSSE